MVIRKRQACTVPVFSRGTVRQQFVSVSLQLRAKVDVSFAGQTARLLHDVEWHFLRGTADPDGGCHWARETVPMLGLMSHQVLVPGRPSSLACEQELVHGRP